MQSAQAEPLKLAAHRAGDRLSQARLTHSRGPDEAEYRCFCTTVELQNAQVFQNAFLDLFQAEVVVVEHLAGNGDIQNVGAGRFPRQLQNHVEPCTRHMIIRRLRGKPFQLTQFAIGLFLHLFWKVGFCQPVFQQLDLAFLRIAAAQFLLDGAQLLPQHIFALFLADFALCVFRNLAAQFQHL